MLSNNTFSNPRRMRFLSLICLVVQNSSLVLLMRYSRTIPGPMYLSSTTVILMEAVKVLCSIAILAHQGGLMKLASVLYVSLVENWVDTLKMLVPAGVYAIQNNLLFVAISHLDAVTFQVSYQMKTLTTAMFTVLMLKKTFSSSKWFALIILSLGVALVQVPSSPTPKPEERLDL